MRRNIIVIISAALMMTGCTQIQTNIDSQKSEMTETVNQIPEPTITLAPEPVDEIEKPSESIIVIDDWKIAYANCLNNIMNNVEPICDSLEAFYFQDYGEGGNMEGSPYYAFFDLTDDGIPELIVSSRAPDNKWMEYAVYEADGKDYINSLTGMFGWDKDEKKIYCGHDLSTEVYEPSPNGIVYVESYTDYDGQCIYEKAGGEEIEITEQEYNDFIRKANEVNADIGAEFKPISRENVEADLGEIQSGSYEDCMTAYRKVLENEQYPYVHMQNPIDTWNNEVREYIVKYGFALINDDEYPELIIYCENEEEPVFLLFSYYDGIVHRNTNIHPFGNIPGGYVERKGIFYLKEADTVNYYGDMVPYFNKTYYRLEGIELEPIVSITSGLRPHWIEGDDGIPYKDDEISYTSVSIFQKDESGVGYDSDDIKVVDEDISEWTEKEQDIVQNKAFRENGLDKKYGFVPTDSKEFDYYSYEEILKKTQ